MRVRRGLLLAALGLAAAAAPAHAASDFEYFEEGADVVLKAIHVGDPATQITWSRCEADVCTPLTATTERRGTLYAQVVVRLAGPPAGSTFEAVVQTPGQSAERFRTLVWNGPQVVETPPTLTGEAKVGGTVEVVPGTARGGFANAYRSPAIEACAQPASGPCFTIATPSYTCVAHPVSERDACRDRFRATIEPRWEGWHLLASESWDSGHQSRVIPAVWDPPPYGPYSRFPQTSARWGVSAPLGPVAAAPAAPPPPPGLTLRADTDTTPKVVLRRRALRRDGRLQLGRVTCPVRCTVKLTVNGRSRTFRVTGTRTLTTPVRKGRLKVRVAVNGKRLASATLKR
jgi:hypothetical protein